MNISLRAKYCAHGDSRQTVGLWQMPTVGEGNATPLPLKSFTKLPQEYYFPDHELSGPSTEVFWLQQLVEMRLLTKTTTPKDELYMYCLGEKDKCIIYMDTHTLFYYKGLYWNVPFSSYHMPQLNEGFNMVSLNINLIYVTIRNQPHMVPQSGRLDKIKDVSQRRYIPPEDLSRWCHRGTPRYSPGCYDVSPEFVSINIRKGRDLRLVEEDLAENYFIDNGCVQRWTLIEDNKVFIENVTLECVFATRPQQTSTDLRTKIKKKYRSDFKNNKKKESKRKLRKFLNKKINRKNKHKWQQQSGENPENIKPEEGVDPGPAKGLVDSAKDVLSKAVEKIDMDDIAYLIDIIIKLVSMYGLLKSDNTIIKLCSGLGIMFPQKGVAAVLRTIKSYIEQFGMIELSFAGLVNGCVGLDSILDKLRANKYANHFAGLFTYVVSCVLSPSLVEYWNSWKIKYVGVKVMDFVSNMPDVFGIVKAFRYILGAVKIFVETHSLEGFLYTESDLEGVATKMSTLQAEFIAYHRGDYNMLTGSETWVFERDVHELRKKVKHLLEGASKDDKRQLTGFMSRLDIMISEIKCRLSQMSARLSTLIVLLSGPSGINKSFITVYMTKVILTKAGYPCGPDYLYYLNDKDKFVSNWKNYYTGIIIDDAANSLPRESSFDIANFVLKSANNTPHNLLASDSGDKGNQWNRSLSMVINTNVTHLYLSYWGEFISSQVRRMPIQVQANVREKYAKENDDGTLSCMIDYSKVPRHIRRQNAPDLWTFTIYKVEIRANGHDCHKQDYGMNVPKVVDSEWRLIPFEFEGKEMRGVDIDTLTRFLGTAAEEHFSQQKECLDAMGNLNDTFALCPKCKVEKSSFCCDCMNEEFDVFPKEEGKRYRERDPEMAKEAAELIAKEKASMPKPNNAVFRAKEKVYNESHGVDCNLQYFPAHEVAGVKSVHDGQLTIEDEEPLELNTGDMTVEQVLEAGREPEEFIRDNVAESKANKKLNRQSGCNDVLYMHSVIDTFESLKVPESSFILEHAFDEYIHAKMAWDKFRETIGNVCDAVMGGFIIFAARWLKEYMKKYKKTSDLVPNQCEGTVIGTIMHTNDPFVKTAACIDYSLNMCCVPYEARQWSKKQNHELWRPVFTFLNQYYKKQNIILDPDYKIEDFVLANAEQCSLEAKESNSFDFLRDTIVPGTAIYYVCTTLIPRFYKSLLPQAGLNLSEADVNVEALNRTQYGSEWIHEICEPPPVRVRRTSEELINKIDKNVVRLMSKEDFSNAVLIDSKRLLVPTHFIEKTPKDEKVRFLRKPVTSDIIPGNAYSMYFQMERVQHIPTTDFSVVFGEYGTVSATLLECFPDAPTPGKGMNGVVIHRDIKGQLVRLPAKRIEHHPNYRQVVVDDGYIYHADNFQGLCGGMLVDESHKHAAILGLHCAGCVSGVSYASLVTKEMIENASEIQLKEQCGSLHPRNTNIQNSAFNPITLKPDEFEHKVHKKSVVLDGDFGPRIRVLGSIKTRGNVKNIVLQSFLKNDIQKIMGNKEIWDCPKLRGKDGTDKNFSRRQMLRKCEKPGYISEFTRMLAREDFIGPIKEELNRDKPRWRKVIRPCDEVEMYNGVEGDPYSKPIHLSSGHSKYRPGRRSAFMGRDESGKIVPDKETADTVQKTYSSWEQGIRTWRAFTGMDKVEGTKSKALDELKTRMFFMGDTAWLVNVRRLTLGLTNFFCTQPEITECAVGMNPHSPRWNKIIKSMERIPGQNYGALDFIAFDLNVFPELLGDAFDILRTILVEVGTFSDAELRAFDTMAEELINNVIDLNGDLVQIPGIILSGISLTSILGCIVNSLYMRCAFYELYKDLPKITAKGFQSHVALLTFGDDSMFKVHKRAKRYNISQIIDVFWKWGIGCTNCYKDNRRLTYMALEEISFLKRGFRYLKEYHGYVAPLEENSIFKCLSVFLPNKNVSEKQIMSQNIDSALMEYRFYGKKHYELRRSQLQEIATRHGIAHFCHFLQVDYQLAVDLWHHKYEYQLDDHIITDRDKIQDIYRRWYDDQYIMSTTGIDTTNNNNNNNNNELVLELETIDEGSPSGTSPVGTESAVWERQSGSITPGASVASNTLFEILEFVEEEEQLVDESMYNVGGHIESTDSNLSDFLKRPVNILDFDWGTSFTRQTFNPWDLFLKNSRVVNRLNNVKLLRGNICIKMLVNGNGFYFGRLISSYLPLRCGLVDLTATDTGQFCQLSQLPHLILDASTSRGGVLKAPFLYENNYLDITTSTDYEFMGKVHVRELNTLYKANMDITTETITVRVYAWMENVEVQGTSSKNAPILVPQSGKMSDVATTISDVATASTPITGAAGTIVAGVAKASSSLLSAMGHSKPTQTEQSPANTLGKGSMSAVANTSTIDEPLALDVHNAVECASPRCGARGDELLVKSIASRWSYIGKIPWNVAATPDTWLGGVTVTPNHTLQGAVFNYPSPASGLMQMFEFWKGGVEFRFEVVASAYHRGRIMVVYDPAGSNVLQQNVQNSQIIDIAKTRSFSVKINNHNRRQWMFSQSGPYAQENGVDTGAFPGHTEDYDYGTLCLYVGTDLAVPNDGLIVSGIEINVWMRCSEDFEVGTPTNVYKNSFLSQQSGTNPDVISEAVMGNDVGEVEQKPEHRYLGERVLSLRPLIHRSMCNNVIGFNNSDTQLDKEYLLPMYGLRKGRFSDGVHQTSTFLPYNYTSTHFLHYIMAAFVGIRGSTKMKFITYHNAGAILDNIIVSRYAASLADYESPMAIDNTSDSTMSAAMLQTTEWNSKGAAISMTKVNGHLECSLPYYSNRNFVETRTHVSTLPGLNEFDSSLKVTLHRTNITDTAGAQVWLSGGDDIDFVYFVGWPRVYQVTTTPVA